MSVATVPDSVLFEVVGPGPDVSGAELMSLLDEGVPSEVEGSRETVGADVSLPLLIASDIVRAHGSRLDVSSRVDGAKSYTFSLAAAP